MGKGRSSIHVKGLHQSYGRRKVLKGITFDLAPGEFVGIIGPNGCGKTTLLRCILGILGFGKGTITVEGRDVKVSTSLEMARVVGMVPQETSMGFEFTVEEVVLMGRYPHIDRFKLEDEKDHDIAEEALKATGTYHLRERMVTNLSGGERQRVIVARALTQEPKVLLLDEPTSHLDIRNQLEILDLIKDLNKKKGLTVLAVFHDLDLASRYCQRLLLMQDGRMEADGTPKEVLTPGNMKATFGVLVAVKRTERGDISLDIKELAV